MKSNLLHSHRPTLCAVLLFGVLALFGSLSLHAQDTVNPLLSTTGPNVLGAGHIQWNNAFHWNHSHSRSFDDKTEIYNGFGITSDFRFGIGNRAELTLGVEAFHYSFESTLSGMAGMSLAPDNYNIASSVGARLLLFEGSSWLPMVTFNTSLAMATVKGRSWAPDETLLQPTIGLSFRNRLADRWTLDYSLGFTWNRNYPTPNLHPLHGSLFVHWLATDKLLLGLGFGTRTATEPFRGSFEARYLASRNLQLTLQAGAGGGSGGGSSIQANALLGVSWMIK